MQNPSSESKKIRLHSPFLHARLPQMFPKVQYTRWSKTPLSRSASEGSSRSAKTGPPMSLASASPIQMNPLLESLTTPIKRMSHQQFCVLIPPFKHDHCLAEHDTPSSSLTTSPPTKPSLPPSLECVTQSTMATRTSNKLKRSFESVELSNTEEPLVKTKKLRRLLPSSIKYDDWNLDLSRLPLRHQHLLTSPFQHLPYRATCKSRPVPRPPVPESALWPADRLRPSNVLPEDSGVQGLKLAVWEHEYRLFRRGFARELNCCLLARQEELKRRLP